MTAARLAAAIMLATLTGCASTPPARVQIPIPIECREPIPTRPAMPTEALLPGATPWVLLRATLAEIDRREGYELQLHAALVVCTAPVKSD